MKKSNRVTDSHSLTRRGFGKGVGAAAIGFGLASAANKSHASAPKKGGHAVFGLEGAQANDTLNPVYGGGMYLITLRLAVYSTLTEVWHDGSIRPHLAESFDASDDATVWRFKMRDGVTFHDGKPLTTDDVIASFNYHRAEDSTSPVKTLLAGVQDISADGNMVVFTLASGNADFAGLVSEFQLAVLPARDGKTYWDPINGSGAYKVLEFKPGISAKLERNENFFLPDRGNFESIELLAINDMNARITSLMSGEVHAVSAIDAKLVSRLQTVEEIDTLVRTSGSFCTYDMLMTAEPFSNNDLRLALKFALNREDFVEKILGGFGVVGNDHPLGPFYKYHPSDIPRHSYDPDKARHHIKKAGLEGVEISLHTSDHAFANSLDGAVLYAEHAKKAGINIKVVREPADGYWSDVWGKKPWFASYWGARSSSDGILSLIYDSNAAWNATGYGNPRVDEMLSSARAELDESVRMELYREVALIIQQEGPSVIPAFYSIIDAVSTKIGYYEAETTTASLSDRRALDRWWFR